MNTTQLKKWVILLSLLLFVTTACKKKKTPTSSTPATAKKKASKRQKPRTTTKTTKYLAIKRVKSVPLKLYVLDCGRIFSQDLSIMFSPGPKNKGRKKKMVDACYLIKHPTKGLLLWDTGLADGLVKMKKGFQIKQLALTLSVRKTLKSQLAKIGVKPSEITYLVFSHLHMDHTGNARYFKNATWLIQNADYNIAFNEKIAKKIGYEPKDYKHLQTAPTIKLNGDYDVFGDGSVMIVFAPGHSKGHQTLLVNLPKTGPVILAGDLYHFEENRKHHIIPPFNSKKETIRSFARIDKLAERMKAKLWMAHDKEQFEKLQHAPQFYE